MIVNIINLNDYKKFSFKFIICSLYRIIMTRPRVPKINK